MSNSDKKIILCTGGAGFIGSHCIIEIIKDGYDVVVADNYSNSSMGKEMRLLLRVFLDTNFILLKRMH